MHRPLKRYTSLPALVYMLQRKALPLLSPDTWDDGNDKHCLAIYKEKRGLSVLLAACFTDAPETYHHWRVFAGETGGCCVTFNREALLKCLNAKPNVRCGPVDYRTLGQMRKTVPAVEELPFIKRSGYKDESEFRVIYESSTGKLNKKDIKVPIDCIDQIVFNPWIYRSLFDSTKKLILSIDGCNILEDKIIRSTLTGNTEWKYIVEDAV